MSWAATFRTGQRPDRGREKFARVLSLHRRGYVTIRLLWLLVYCVDCFVRERRDLSGSRLCGCGDKCTVFKSPPGRCPRRDLSVGIASSADTGRAVRPTDAAAERMILSAHGRIRRDLIWAQNRKSQIVLSSFRNHLPSHCREADCAWRRNRGADRFGDLSTFWHIWADAKIRRLGVLEELWMGYNGIVYP